MTRQHRWTMLVVATAWQPLTDPPLSHLTRWLAFRGLPTELHWIAVAAAARILSIVCRSTGRFLNSRTLRRPWRKVRNSSYRSPRTLSCKKAPC